MILTADVTVVIACHPPRFTHRMLGRALKSVIAQTVQPAAIVVANDVGREGSADTRNRALAAATTEWVAFLDSDDQFLPTHLGTLYWAATEPAAPPDVVYSWPRVIDQDGTEIPRHPDWGGGPVFDPDLLRRKAHIQTTSLVRTEWAQAVGGFTFRTDDTGAVNDDHGFYLRLLDAGARFLCVPEQTFLWLHHGRSAPGRDGNTSGQADTW
jgi:glycosyltransferase involved in cell wall biosynthesis